MGRMPDRGLVKLAAILFLAATAAAGAVIVLQSQRAQGRRSLVVATTTSLFDTGVLDAIETAFETAQPVDLRFIAVGSGLALQLARRGDADVLLVHDPPAERRFLEEGYGLCREVIAFNFFAIVGPRGDPAGIAGRSAAAALRRLAEEARGGRAVWVSRGDDSGTHSREKALWAAAGYDWRTLGGEGWYREAGAGMGRTLLMAEEFRAYTLSDLGTYLMYSRRGLVTSVVQVGESEELINVYSAIAVNPLTIFGSDAADAIAFIHFLTSEEGQAILGGHGAQLYGRNLFQPAVRLLREGADTDIARWILNSASIEAPECPVDEAAQGAPTR